MKHLILLALGLGVNSCSQADSTDWTLLIARSEALLQEVHLDDAGAHQFGALTDGLNILYDEFFGLNSTPALWLNLDAVTTYGSEEAVGDALLLSEEVWQAREQLLIMHRSEDFFGLSIDGKWDGNSKIISPWGKTELLLLVEFFPPEDPLWDAFLHAAKVVWEESNTMEGYPFCFDIWEASIEIFGDWKGEERFASWVPSWQAGVRFDLILMHEWLLQFSQGEVAEGGGTTAEIFFSTAEEMLTFYEGISWGEMNQIDPAYFGQELRQKCEEANWLPGWFTGEGIFRFHKLMRD